MLAYIIRRLLLMIPTLFVIILLNFVFVQFAPGGPVEQAIAQIQGRAVDATARISGSGGDQSPTAQRDQSQSRGDSASKYRGARGLDPQLVKELERQFGFDKPAHERFWQMLGNYLKFDFG